MCKFKNLIMFQNILLLFYRGQNRLFDDNNKNKGIMSEAIISIVNYGFNNMNLERIEAFVDPNNAPSINIEIQEGRFFKTPLF